MIELVIHQRRRDLGGFEVGRVLPNAERRTVGPFVFFDHMGPVNINVKTLSSYEESLWLNGNPSPGGTGDNPGGGRSREAKQRDGSPGNEDNDVGRGRFGLEGSDH